MIYYSLARRNKRPGDASSEKKVYATTQCRRTLTADQMADHISKHNSKYNRGDILAMLYSVAQCMEEHLLEGYIVDLYDLGTFYPVLHSQAADSAAEFSHDNIIGLSVNWRPSKRFRTLFKRAKFELTTTRAIQARSLKESKRLIFGSSSSSEKD